MPKSDARYLLTLPLSADCQGEFSVYYNETMFAEMVDVPENQIVDLSHDAIAIVVHGPSARSTSHSYRSALSEHCIEFSALTSDRYSAGRRSIRPYPFHKMGGRPYFHESRASLEDAVAHLYKRKYVQMLQLDYIVQDEMPWSGTWPFGDGLLHLFSKPPFESKDWCWLWQY